MQMLVEQKVTVNVAQTRLRRTASVPLSLVAETTAWYANRGDPQFCAKRRLYMSEELEVLKMVGDRLGEAGIGYMVSGSIAANYYTIPRMTREADDARHAP